MNESIRAMQIEVKEVQGTYTKEGNFKFTSTLDVWMYEDEEKKFNQSIPFSGNIQTNQITNTLFQDTLLQFIKQHFINAIEIKIAMKVSIQIMEEKESTNDKSN